MLSQVSRSRLQANLFRLFVSLPAIASLAFCQQGAVTGTIVDSSGASIVDAKVKLALDGRGPDQEILSSDAGRFAFQPMSAGPYRLSIAAKGFAEKTVAGEVHAGETVKLAVALDISASTTSVDVTLTQDQLAQEQVKTAEKQLLLGVLPNFFVNYEPNPAPLKAKQKFELTAKTWFYPSAFVINGIIAGVGQARNTNPGFGQGAQGYGKRYGAAFAGYGTMLLVEKFVLPTVFHQDPRYFYKGTGSTKSRIFYAIRRALVCQGDNGKAQVCYSSLIGNFGTGFATNYYYPKADRNSNATVIQSSIISIGGRALGNLFQEFLAKKIMRKKP